MGDTVTLLAPVWSLLLFSTGGPQATEAGPQLTLQAVYTAVKVRTMFWCLTHTNINTEG